jgi:hypothetical protein
LCRCCHSGKPAKKFFLCLTGEFEAGENSEKCSLAAFIQKGEIVCRCRVNVSCGNGIHDIFRTVNYQTCFRESAVVDPESGSRRIMFFGSEIPPYPAENSHIFSQVSGAAAVEHDTKKPRGDIIRIRITHSTHAAFSAAVAKGQEPPASVKDFENSLAVPVNDHWQQRLDGREICLVFLRIKQFPVNGQVRKVQLGVRE